MSSKQIFDSPQLLEELPLLDMSQVRKFLPIEISRSTIERWIRIGVRGVRLETVKVGNRRYVTQQSIQRFLVAQQHVDAEKTKSFSKRGSMSKRTLSEARRKFKLPDPLESDRKESE